MNWSVRTGFRLLFWLADHLIGDAITQEQREGLHAIMVSFSNGSDGLD